MSGGGGERGWESTGEDGEWTGVDEYTEAGGDSEYSGESSAATPDSETPDLEPLWEKKLPARPEQPEQEAAGTPGVWEVDLYDSDAPVHQAMPDAAAAKAADAAPAGHTSGSNGSNAAPAGPVRVTVTVSGLGVAHLPKMDRMGKCDPYVVVEVKGEGGGSGNAVQRTATIKNRYDAAFAETFLFAGVDVALDAADGLSSSSAASAGRAHLVLRVMDWDRFGKDEEVGRTVITLDRKSVGILGAEKSAETLLTSPSGKVAQGHDGQPTVISFTLAFSGLPQEPAHPTVALDFSAAGQVVSSPPATHSPPVVEVSPPATRSPPVLEGLPSRSSLGSISSDDESSPSVASGVEFSQRSPWRVERLTGDYSTIAEDAEGEGGEERGTVSRYHGGEDVSRGPRGEGGGGVGAAHLEPRELYSTPKAEHAANGGGGGSEARGGGSAERGARNLASQVPWAGTPSSGKKEAGEWKVSVELHQVMNLQASQP
ncbi:hypothetical protein T484DRAFT_1824501 [Baffinella frigidus]|nr:hypothetical protein T484DRAFT_1824501 [Cryptophyta sp. CCMP2293]